jgi:iron complex outermembrane receptor protein
MGRCRLAQQRRRPRLLLVAAALLLTSATQAATLHSAIPPQPLQTALADWAAQTNLQVAYLASVVREQNSRGAASGLAPEAALTQLLRGTGLQFEFLNSELVRIEAPPPADPAAGADASPSGREEMVVIGSRWRASEASVTKVAWNREDLDAAQIEDVVRLANLTPGVTFDSYQDYGAGIETNISIRGVNARDGSTVAIYLDDIPLPTDRASIFGRAFPLLFDLDHVEILRGPQGVLMGEGAEGGAMRLIRAQPTLGAFGASTTADYSTTMGGAPSYELSGIIDASIWPDRMGVRVSAWSRRDGGFVDRVDWPSLAPIELSSNSTRRDAVSGTLAFEVTPRVRLGIAVDHQSIDVDDSSAFAAALSDPENGVFRNDKYRQPYIDRYRLPSLRLVAQLGFGRLVYEAASFDRWASAVTDTNEVPQISSAPHSGIFDGSLDQRFISEHLQIERTDPTARFAWFAGAASLHSDYEEIQDLISEAFGEQGGIDGRLHENLGTRQTAAFGQSDLKVGNRFTATLGLRLERWSYDSRSLIEDRSFSNSIPQYFTTRDASTETIPRVALSYRSANGRVYYASAAKGYRMGGFNLPLGSECGTPTPATYASDTVWSYEFGEKGRSFGGRLRDEISLFHSSWRNLQLQIPYQDCGYGYTSNAGAATSDGIEFGVEGELSSRLNLKVAGAYVDAHHTQTVDFLGHAVVQKGDVVGASPLVQAPFSASAVATYTIPLRGAVVTLRGQDTFQGNNPGPFSTDHPDGLIYAPERRPDPAFRQVDLSARIQWRSLSLAAFVLNARSAQPTLQLRNRAPGAELYATTLRPRTIGISVKWQLQSSAGSN